MSDSLFSSIVDLSQRSDARVMCHIHETTGEVEESIKQYGMNALKDSRLTGYYRNAADRET